jgi:hypothetical protein
VSLAKDVSPLFGSKLTGKSGAVDKYKKLQKEAASRRGSLTWADAGPEDLQAACVSVTEDGAALLLAKTSDGGALVMRVIMDRESIPFYAPDMAALSAMLAEVTEVNKMP